MEHQYALKIIEDEKKLADKFFQSYIDDDLEPMRLSDDIDKRNNYRRILRLIRKHGLKKSNITLIPDRFDLTKFKAKRRQHGKIWRKNNIKRYEHKCEACGSKLRRVVKETFDDIKLEETLDDTLQETLEETLEETL